MKTLVSKKLYEIKLDEEINLFYLSLYTSEMGIDEFRDIWDETTTLMKSCQANKIIFDTQKTGFSNAVNLVSVTEGLVQLMCNNINCNRLYFAYLISVSCFDEMKTKPIIRPEYNQSNKIDYDFFKSINDAFLWMSKIHEAEKRYLLKDDDYLAKLESDIKDDLEKNVGIDKISELKNFPFQDLEGVAKAYNENKISLASDYNYDRLMLYAKKSEIIIHHIWLGLPFLILFFNLFFAIFSRQWIMLLGCLTAVLGHLTSSPYFKPRDALTALSLMASIAFIFINWKIAIIIGSYTLSSIFIMTARETYKEVIISRALSKETSFIYFFINAILLVRDNKTMKILLPRQHGRLV